MSRVVSPFSPVEELAEISQRPDDRSLTVSHSQNLTNDSIAGGDADSEDLQRGVKEAEAVAAAWSKRALVAAYAGYAQFLAPSAHPLDSTSHFLWVCIVC